MRASSPSLLRSALGLTASIALAACAAQAGDPGNDPEQPGAGGSGATGAGGSSGSGAVGTGGAMQGSGGASMSGAGGAVAAGTGGTPPASGGAMSAGTGGTPGAGTGAGATSGTGGATASGPGLNVGGKCFPACAFPAISDPDPMTGAVDGYGWEGQQACLDPASAAAMTAMPCEPPAAPVAPTPGDGGVYTGDSCHPFCSSTQTDLDMTTMMLDGWGYEHGQSCIVAGTAAAIGGISCDPMLPPLGTGDGVQINDEMGMPICHPICRDVVASMPDANGWGWENETNCILAGSVAQLQGVPCDAPDPPTPPPPAPAPTGTGWSADYTATMFGEVDCKPFGFDDPGDSNLNYATCVGRGITALNGDNDTWFGAVGDLSTLWSGSQCTCSGGGTGKCSTAPSCTGQTNCGQCVEVTCNGTGTYSYMGDGYTHDEYCKPNVSVVVQLIDACPHNHPNNPYWCTTMRPNHVDISCSAFNELVQGSRPIGEIGFINAYARKVDCSVGLGVHSF